MDEGSVGALALIVAPFIIFMVIVAPVWIIMHYLSASRRERMARMGGTVSPEDQEMMGRMVGLLERMEGRIGTLEKILEADDPKWRERRAVNERL